MNLFLCILQNAITLLRYKVLKHFEKLSNTIGQQQAKYRCAVACLMDLSSIARISFPCGDLSYPELVHLAKDATTVLTVLKESWHFALHCQIRPRITYQLLVASTSKLELEY